MNSGFYFDNKCKNSCKTCIDTSIKCTSCDATSEFKYLYPTDNNCLISCPSGHFNNADNTCTPCSLPCKECQGDSNRCTACDPNAVDSFLVQDAYICVSKCPIGNYQNNALCVPCEAPCKECSSRLDCTACLPNDPRSTFYEARCYEGCPFGSVKSVDGCSKCNSKCRSCTVSIDKCTSCYSTGSTKYLFGEHCVDTCP